MALQALLKVAVNPWYIPWVVGLDARNKEPGWEEQTLAALSRREQKVQSSDFARFHRRQALRWGALFVAASVLTLGIGLILCGLPYLVGCWVLWSRARRGRWVRLPVVGPALPEGANPE